MPFHLAASQIKKTKEEILAQLQESRQKNNAIGIFVKANHELITTAVVDIGDTPSGDFIISLKQHDLHGYPLTTTRLFLSDIESVIHFNIPFDDPQYVKVRRKEKFKV